MTTRESSRRKEARHLLLRHGYAVGGHVSPEEATAPKRPARIKPKKAAKPKRVGHAPGEAPQLRADKPRRAAGGRAKKPGTKIIIVNGRAQPVAVPRPVAVQARLAPPLPAGPRPGMPPGLVPPPLPPGAPPLAAKRGGRIAHAPRLTAGAKSALGRLEKIERGPKG